MKFISNGEATTVEKISNMLNLPNEPIKQQPVTKSPVLPTSSEPFVVTDVEIKQSKPTNSTSEENNTKESESNKEENKREEVAAQVILDSSFTESKTEITNL